MRSFFQYNEKRNGEGKREKEKKRNEHFKIRFVVSK